MVVVETSVPAEHADLTFYEHAASKNGHVGNIFRNMLLRGRPPANFIRITLPKPLVWVCVSQFLFVLPQFSKENPHIKKKHCTLQNDECL